MVHRSITINIIVLAMSLLVTQTAFASTPWWEFQSVDTMKFSRDKSREYLDDRQGLLKVAEEQAAQIAGTGATHINISTPYDEEFLPVLKIWVEMARKENLKIWFRGNWSGWEGWFGYSDITREEHIAKTVAFITANPDLFEDGDVFSACPECENGGPGDPRMTGDAASYRQFLIAEHQAIKAAFSKIGKKVQSNYNSMNGDVAKLIMDKPTTAALGGLVVVDHYVETPEQLNRDVTEYAERSGGRVILGEFGAPIPDIHGEMTSAQQAEWLESSLSLLAHNPHLAGLSYWTGQGGSTAIWSSNNQEKPAVQVLRSYYQPKVAAGKVVNRVGQPLSAVSFSSERDTFVTDASGLYSIAYRDPFEITITSPGYKTLTMTSDRLAQTNKLVLEREMTTFWFRLQAAFLSLFGK